MLLKYFYDQSLAHASYLVGCQKTNEAIVIDAGRDVQQYLIAASNAGLKIVAAAETHIHADFVAGSRELAARTGARLFLSDEGPPEWKYEYASQYEHQLLKDGDEFYVGRVKFTTLHTPGHTPEHICFLLTDEGGGADQPMGLFSGDFVFVNALGRPDLLETAAGITGSAEEGARSLFQSAEKFKQLPDHLQIWPAHGAGSACGKGLGAIPSSTVGYEKRFNPAMQFNDEQLFVQYILDDQPETPDYFKIMKRVNKEGPDLLMEQPAIRVLGLTELESSQERGELIIDTRNRYRFAEGHLPGSILIEFNELGNWAGWFVDYEKPVYLICNDEHRGEAVRVLQKIGVDTIGGVFDARALANAGLNTQTFPHHSPDEIAQRVSAGEFLVLDVRSDSEWNGGHIPQAQHRFLGKLDETISSINSDKPILAHCGSGIRSAIAASILQAAGFDQVHNLDGGFSAWKKAGLPVETDQDQVGAV